MPLVVRERLRTAEDGLDAGVDDVIVRVIEVECVDVLGVDLDAADLAVRGETADHAAVLSGAAADVQVSVVVPVLAGP